MIANYVKKPVIVQALQYIGDNYDEILMFVGDNCIINTHLKKVVIKTLEGNMLCNVGDYIIRGVEGEFYPCRKDIFEKTYVRTDN